MGITNYVWDPLSDNVLMETDENNDPTAVYTNEPGEFGELISQRRGNETSYYHYDGQGSTRQLTDESGSITDTATYTAFGEEVASSGTTVNPFGYKGALGYYANPETDDIYVRARTYQPNVARWLSLDPLVFIDGPNNYLYGENDPINWVDPSGELCIRVGTPQYGRCGAFQWNAQLHLIPKTECNGFVIQRVVTRFAVEACPGQVIPTGSPAFRGSARCPLFETADPANVETLLYWEMWPIDNAGRVVLPGIAIQPRVTDLFRSVGLHPLETRGGYMQAGAAYFVKGNTPPGGFASWKIDPTKPPHRLYYRCTKPPGEPNDATTFPVRRSVVFEWDCCQSPAVEPKCQPVPGRPFNVLQEGLEVKGLCKNPQKGI